MGEQKHTRGPWSVGRKKVRNGYMRWIDGLVVHHGQGSIHELATLRGDPRSAVENEANARLIAAAPELLAALKDLVYRGADGHWYVSYREDSPVDFAGAAIAKAEEVKT